VLIFKSRIELQVYTNIMAGRRIITRQSQGTQASVSVLQSDPVVAVVNKRKRKTPADTTAGSSAVKAKRGEIIGLQDRIVACSKVDSSDGHLPSLPLEIVQMVVNHVSLQ
jgi:hypothetical protein